MSGKRVSRGQKRAAKVEQRRKRAAQDVRRLRERDDAEGRELDEAERAAAEILGYRVTADNEHEFTDEEVEEFDSLAEQLLRDPGAVDREFDALMDLVADGLQNAVQETVDSRSPEPARRHAAKIRATDDEVVPDGETAPGRMAAFLTLAEWLGRAGEHGGGPAPSETAIGWIAESLGQEAADAARTVGGFLDGDEEGLRAGEPAADLGETLLPAMIWMAASVTATHGGGDAAWLRSLPERSDGTVGADR